MSTTTLLLPSLTTMLTPRSSPPPRSRSPSARHSSMMSPVPSWNLPDAPALPLRSPKIPSTPTSRSPAFSPRPESSRAAYDVTSPRPHRPRQPLPETPCLLPPVPLNTTPQVGLRQTFIIDKTSPSLGVTLTPPRPARRRYDSPRETPTRNLSSPADITTPRAENKRDSTQRRLSALRGLVANIDFNQPWSLPDLESRPAATSVPPVPQDHGWPETPTRNAKPRPRHRTEKFDVASSGYSSCAPAGPASPVAPPTPDTTWRSTLSSDLIYTRMLQVRPAEVKRQEIMWEMCETEQSFLRSMRHVLRLFATPLKTPQGSWIDGIPTSISDLFDALEGIAHIHGIVAAAQRDMRRKTEVIDLGQFAAILKAWVPKLDAYEWYLLRFEDVVALVEEHVRDPESVFGEFVRMQLSDDALGSMSLSSMLLKPVQRLMKYPLFIKRLLDATRCHPDLLSLLASTESTIQRLQTIKAKDEEYRQLEFLEARLAGLPLGFRLAQKGRRLVAQGIVRRINPGLPSSTRSSVSSSTSSGSPWDFTSPSRTSSFSVSSSSSGPSRNGSLRISPSRFSSPSPKRGMHRSPSGASIAESPRTGATRSKRRDELTVFIFDDVVMLAQTQDKGGLFSTKSKKEKGWRMIPENEGGLGQVAEVRDWSGYMGQPNMFTLTLVSSAGVAVTTCLTVSTPGKPLFSCSTLTTLPQFLDALGEATIPGTLSSESDPEEVINAEAEWSEHPLLSLKALGY